MKLTALFLTVGLFNVYANGVSQTVSFSGQNVPLESVFSSVEKQTDYVFMYSAAVLKSSKPVSIKAQNVDLKQFLSEVFRSQPLEYSIVTEGKSIFIFPKPIAAFSEQQRSNEAADLRQDTLRDVKGRVVDEKGDPVAGATVVVKGTNKGTLTNAKGEFIVRDVDENAVLSISSLGSETKEVKISGKGAILNISLTKVVTNLDELQIIAYGKVSKRLNTGDVVTIKGEDIAKNPVGNVLEALKGSVPGMFVQQATGQPGSNFIVQLRGTGSFSSGLTPPLYVIDGVVFSANSTIAMLNPSYQVSYPNSNGTLSGSNALNYFDPSQIESVEILKDADATAIYGSRGAYGVVLITTKKGKAGSPHFNVNAYTGITVRGVMPKMVNTQEYLELRREAFKNDGLLPGPADYDVNGTWDTTRNVNWNKYFTGDHAMLTNVSGSYSGGVGNTSYLIGGNYRRQGNIQNGIGSQSQGGINFNINTGSLNQKLTLSLSGSYLSTINTMLPEDMSSVVSSFAPNHPDLYLPNGKLDWTYGNGSNPAARLMHDYNDVTNNLVSTAVLRYKPVKGLTLNASVGYNYLTMRELYTTRSTFYNYLLLPNPNLSAQSFLQQTSRSTINFDPYANYFTGLGKLGRLDVTTGLSMQNGQNYVSSINGSNFATDALLSSPTNGVSVYALNSSNPNRQLGYFARVNYNWDQKYVLNLSGRYDGSTKFGPGDQFGVFGSVGAAWIFTEEPWVKKHLSFLSFGKLRGSYGITGGDAIANYAYLSRYSISNNSYQGGIQANPVNIANPNLHWETDRKKEIAIELQFFKDRIFIQGTYYNNRSSNQLLGLPISVVTGFPTITQNSPALIGNEGLEGTLTTLNIRSKSFTWKTVFNISRNRNKLLKYPDNNGVSLLQVNADYVVGKSLMNKKLYPYAGVDPQTGQYFFTNAKGEMGPYISAPYLAQADKTVNLDLAPQYFGGLGNTFSYKRFTLDFFFNFAKKNGRNFYGQQTFLPGFFEAVPTRDALDRWQKPGDITAFPKLTTNLLQAYLSQSVFINSTGGYSSVFYARLQNVNLSYDLAPAILKKAHITRLTAYVKAQNILTISRYGNLDPENMAAGSMGPYKIFTGGLNVTF